MRVHIAVLGLGLVSAFVVGGIAAPPSDYGLQTVESYRESNPQYGAPDGTPYGAQAAASALSARESSSMQPSDFPAGIPGGELPGRNFVAGTGSLAGESLTGDSITNSFPTASGGMTASAGHGIQAEQRLPPKQADGAVSFGKSGVPAVEKGPEVASAGEIIGFNGFDGSGSQTITLVHTGKMQIAVYHIDRSGQLTLVSSRPIEDDFSFSFNVNAPLPREIRLLGSQVK